MMSLTVVMLLSYLAFIYFSESLNPFVKPSLQRFRSRWRYGRRMALAVLAGGLIAVALSNLLVMPMQLAIAAGLVVSIGLGLFFSLDRIRHVFLS